MNISRTYTSVIKRKYGLTASEMAETLNISKSTLYRYLRDPKLKKVVLKQLKLKEKKDIFRQ